MRSALLLGCFSGLVLSVATSLDAAVYQQDFETGFTESQSIGTATGTGTNSTQAVQAAAKHTGDFGWRFFAANQNGQRYRAYDSNVLTQPLTQNDSFELSFWINNNQKANSSLSVGFVGLFDSTSTAGSTNSQASMKHFIGLNLGGADADRHPVYAFTVDVMGAWRGASTGADVNDAKIVGGFQQWYQVIIDYDADTRQFTFNINDSSNANVKSATYTLPGAATFSVNAFGGSNGVASDGRSMGVYIDDVSIVPEPATAALSVMGVLLLAQRRR